MSVNSLDELQTLVNELETLGIVEQLQNNSSLLTKAFSLQLYRTYIELMMKSPNKMLSEDNEFDVILVSLLRFLEEGNVCVNTKNEKEFEWMYLASLLIYSYVKEDVLTHFRTSSVNEA